MAPRTATFSCYVFSQRAVVGKMIITGTTETFPLHLPFLFLSVGYWLLLYLLSGRGTAFPHLPLLGCEFVLAELACKDIALLCMCASINILKAAIVGSSCSDIFSLRRVSLQPVSKSRHKASWIIIAAMSKSLAASFTASAKLCLS